MQLMHRALILQAFYMLLFLQTWGSITVAKAFIAWLEHAIGAAEARVKVQGSVMQLMHSTLFLV